MAVELGHRLHRFPPQHIGPAGLNQPLVAQARQPCVQRENALQLLHTTQLVHREIALRHKIEHRTSAEYQHRQQKHPQDDPRLGHKPQATHERQTRCQEGVQPGHAVAC